MASLTLNPFRLWRRHRRLRQAADQEVFYLRQRHGDGAHKAALEQLNRRELTSWGRQVMEEAARRLKPEEAATAPADPPPSPAPARQGAAPAARSRSGARKSRSPKKA